MSATGDSHDASVWFEAALAMADDDVDVATEVLAGLGCDGSEVHELGGGRSEMRVFFEATDEHAAAGRGRALEASLAGRARFVGLRRLDPRVWREDWKRHFERMAVGERFEIFPPWEREAARASSGGRMGIVINPGMAFGTGRHETTATCLEILESVVRVGDVVLDLGCGTGILAIAAIKLGAARVVAVDNDPEALLATAENADMNEVRGIEVRLLDGPPDDAPAGFDVAVANILAEPLADMAARLTACVTDTGVLVLSGIESKRRALVEVAYGRQGWRVTRDIERSGWVSLALREN